MILRATASAVLILALGLGGCASLKTGRDRIVKTAAVCVDQTVAIYFEPESAAVTREGRAVLTAAATQSRSCKVGSVDVLGLSDSIGGDPGTNFDLSTRRAQSVTAALTAVGLPAAQFRVTAAGETGAVTADGKAKPMRRRADVVLHLSRR